MRTRERDLAKSDGTEKTTYPTKKESEEEREYSVSSEYGMDTDSDTGDVSDAV